MKIKALLIILLATIAFAGSVRADVLFEDNFDSYVNLPEEMLSWGFTGLATAAPDLWVSPFPAGSTSDAKVGPGRAGEVYWSGNDATDNNLRLYQSQIVGDWGTDYTVSADFYKLTDKHTTDEDGNGWVDYEDYIPEMYVAGRVANGNYVIGGIVLADNYDDETNDYNYDTSTWTYIGDDYCKDEIYVRIRDSYGASNGDTYVCKISPEYPVNISMDIVGNVVTVTVTHAGTTKTVSLNTTVSEAGSPGFGIWRRWGGYAKAYSDNFSVIGDPYFASIDGDINGDLSVDLDDVAAMAADWVKCTDPADPSCDQYWKF